jgi:hypothetical protein
MDRIKAIETFGLLLVMGSVHGRVGVVSDTVKALAGELDLDVPEAGALLSDVLSGPTNELEAFVAELLAVPAPRAEPEPTKPSGTRGAR